VENSFFNTKFNPQIFNSRVGYGIVEVNEINPNTEQDLIGKTVYHFYTPKEVSPVIIFPEEDNSSYIAIKNEDTGKIGKLKKIEMFEKMDNSYYLIKKDIVEYKNSINFIDSSEEEQNFVLAKQGYQGDFVIQSIEMPIGYTNQYHWSRNLEDDEIHAVIRKNYNIFQTENKSTTYFWNEDYSARDSLMTETRSIGFDAFSGATISTVVKDSEGNKHYSFKEPAYWHYVDMDRKNMLSQGAVEKQYIVPSNVGLNFHNLTINNNIFNTQTLDNLYLNSANITTWKDWFEEADANTNNPQVWRQNDTYQFIGKKEDYQPFMNWNDEDTGNYINNIWKRTSNITKYDRYGHPTEELGLDGIYTAAIYDHNDALPVAIVTNAEYQDVLFENFNNGGFNKDFADMNEDRTNTPTSMGAATKACYSDMDNSTSIHLQEGRKYLVSFWLKKGTANDDMIVKIFNETENTSLNIATTPSDDDGWVYYEHVIEPDNLLAGECNLHLLIGTDEGNPDMNVYHYVDDLRLHPLEAEMSTYTYDKLTDKLTSITDVNNVSTYFEYDDAGRLIRVLDQDKNILTTHKMTYGRDVEEEQ
jgi:YD repeat-containing protein